MLARGNEYFRALGEHGFSFFQVKMFTGSVSALLTSTSLKINNDKLQKKLKLCQRIMPMYNLKYFNISLGPRYKVIRQDSSF